VAKPPQSKASQMARAIRRIVKPYQRAAA
jgi:hypothetical protein